MQSEQEPPADPLEAMLKAVLESGRIIDERERASFVGRVNSAAVEIGKLLEDGQPARASHLLETFVEACSAKRDDLDDEDYSFWKLVRRLTDGWIGARQAARLDAEETVSVLLRWAADEGFQNDLPLRAVELLDVEGLRALYAQLMARHAPPGTWERRRDGRVLKAIALRCEDIDAYLSHCDGGPTPTDCQNVATIHRAAGRFDQALAWIEKGLRPQGKVPVMEMGWGLPVMRSAVLAQLGRGAEAIESAWSAFREQPCSFLYEELLRYVPESERELWAAKAIDAVEAAELGGALDVLTTLGAIDRLAERVKQSKRSEFWTVNVSPEVAELAAHALEERYPRQSAQVRTALALRVLASKPADYGEVLGHLAAARDLLVATGGATEWDALAKELLDRYRRRRSFVEGCHGICRGEKSDPSLVERASRAGRTRKMP